MGSNARVHLRQLAIANRCTVDWNTMRGDGAVRFCGQCRQQVYNLSEMTEAAVEALLDESTDRCVRFMYRRDGTIVTSACPPATRSRAPGVAAVALATSTAFVGITAVVDGPDAPSRSDDRVLVAMGGALRINNLKPKKRVPRPAPDPDAPVSDASPDDPWGTVPVPAPAPAPSLAIATATAATSAEVPSSDSRSPWVVAVALLLLAASLAAPTVIARSPTKER